MDSAVIIAIVSGVVTIVGAIITALVAEWRRSVKREAEARDQYIAHLLAQVAEAGADRRNLEQRLQFGMDTLKAQGELLGKSVSVSEKALEFNDKLLERVERALRRIERSPTARDRADDT